MSRSTFAVPGQTKYKTSAALRPRSTTTQGTTAYDRDLVIKYAAASDTVNVICAGPHSVTTLVRTPAGPHRAASLSSCPTLPAPAQDGTPRTMCSIHRACAPHASAALPLSRGPPPAPSATELVWTFPLRHPAVFHETVFFARVCAARRHASAGRELAPSEVTGMQRTRSKTRGDESWRRPELGPAQQDAPEDGVRRRQLAAHGAAPSGLPPGTREREGTPPREETASSQREVTPVLSAVLFPVTRGSLTM